MTRVCLLLSLVGVVLIWAHGSEPAHYKYSKEANEVRFTEGHFFKLVPKDTLSLVGK